jgi:hypothetical protein
MKPSLPLGVLAVHGVHGRVLDLEFRQAERVCSTV